MSAEPLRPHAESEMHKTMSSSETDERNDVDDLNRVITINSPFLNVYYVQLMIIPIPYFSVLWRNYSRSEMLQKV